MEMLNITRYENTDEERAVNAEYYKDDKGRDWYKHQALFDKKWIIATDFDGNITCITKDVTGVRPDNRHVFDCDQLPDGIGIGRGWTYINGKFEQDLAYVRESNVKTRKALLRDAADEVSALEYAETLGDMTDEETANLKAWRDYRLAIARVDVDKTNIVWPAKPL